MTRGLQSHRDKVKMGAVRLRNQLFIIPAELMRAPPFIDPKAVRYLWIAKLLENKYVYCIRDLSKTAESFKMEASSGGR